MTNVIHPAKTMEQKLHIDATAQALITKACHDFDVAKESMGTAANRLYSIGFRAEFLRAKGGDKHIIQKIDIAIIATMPEQARHLLATKPVDLNTTDKAIRVAYIKNLADKRTALSKALAKCEDAENAGAPTPITVAARLVQTIEKMLADIAAAEVVDPKTEKNKLEGVNIMALKRHLGEAKKELT